MKASLNNILYGIKPLIIQQTIDVYEKGRYQMILLVYIS